MAYPNLVDLHALQLKLYIGGQFVEAPLTLPVIDPATEEVIVNAPAGEKRMRGTRECRKREQV